MGWGTVANVTTANLDSAADDPSQARVEIYNALIELQAVINGRNAASGVAGLNSSSKITASQIPDTINSSSSIDLALVPSTGKVSITNIINLNPRTLSELNALTGVAGDVAYCSNGNAGAATLAVHNGTAWKVVALGATIS
jgi:hypothetical protein